MNKLSKNKLSKVLATGVALMLSLPALMLFLPALLLSVCPVQAQSIWNRLPDWNSFHNSSGSNGYRMRVDSSEQVKGKPSAVLQSEKPDQPDQYFVGLWQSFDAREFTGKHVEFSGLIKTKAMRGRFNAFVKVKQDAEVVRFDNMENRPIREAADWEPFSIVLDVPAKATSIAIGFMFAGGGTAWLNDLTFKSVPNDTKTTEIKWDSQKFHHYRWDEPTAPTNLDFAKLAHPLAPKVVAEWGVHTTEGYEGFVDRETKLNGQVSACLRSISKEPRDFALINQDISAKQYRGKRLRFAAYIKTNDVKDWTGLMMRVKGGNNILAFDNMEDRPIKGTADWKPYSIVLDVPEQSTDVRIGFLLAGVGSAWMSNLKLDTVGTDVPLTEKTVDLGHIPPDTLRLRPNLEFKQP